MSEAPHQNPPHAWAWWVTLTALALAIMVLVATAAYGGFGERAAQIREVPAGTAYVNGPLETRWDHATAVRWGEGWRIHVDGMCRNVTDDGYLASSGTPRFLGVAIGQSVEATGDLQRRGLHWFPAHGELDGCRLQFDLNGSWRPETPFAIQDWVQEYRDVSITQSGGNEKWTVRRDRSVIIVTVPLVVVKES